MKKKEIHDVNKIFIAYSPTTVRYIIANLIVI